eukprot:3580683-Prymnesium_polylepis.1
MEQRRAELRDAFSKLTSSGKVNRDELIRILQRGKQGFSKVQAERVADGILSRFNVPNGGNLSVEKVADAWATSDRAPGEATIADLCSVRNASRDGAPQPESKEVVWTLEGWLSSELRGDLSNVIGRALSAGLVAVCDAVDIGKPFVPTAADSPHSRARDGLPHSSRGEGLDDRKLCDELAKLDEPNARAAIRHLLLENCITDGLVDVLYGKMKALSNSMKAAGGGASALAKGTQSKFSQQEDELASLTYGGISTFFKGLEGFLGMPSSNLLDAMGYEHTKGPDHDKDFQALNYDTLTTSHIE